MDLKDLSKPLTVDQIDFRVQSINNGGYATILAYKDARVDMQRLDEVVGPLNWKREHSGANHNCTVSIWCDDKKEWISKEDTGTASNTEAEKGLASDSFKRACFNWGIGRELYDYPLIQIQLNGDGTGQKDEWQKGQGNVRPKATWNLKLRDWKWYSKFDGEGKIIMLAAKDTNNKLRFEWRDLSMVAELANQLLEMISTSTELTEIGELFNCLEEWEQTLLWTAKTKGGWFSQEDKELIRKAEQAYLNPTEEAA